MRLGGIDAPEERQPFGARSRQALSDLTFGQMAELRCNKIDRYKRHVCAVWVAPSSAPEGPRTLDAGHALLTLGLAWWYRAYAREQSAQERGQYAFSEQEAKAKGVGLWADPAPVPPWEWRKALRTRDQR